MTSSVRSDLIGQFSDLSPATKMDGINKMRMLRLLALVTSAMSFSLRKTELMYVSGIIDSSVDFN